MSVDTPAHVTILGAGPIGLETALYARYLGYDVGVYEAARVCETLRSMGHLTLFSPFGQIRSPLGLAALRAQDENWHPPGDDEFLTGAELVERYYLPLAQSDLLVDFIHQQVAAQCVGREWMHKREMPDSDDRAASDFRILLQSSASDSQPPSGKSQRFVASDVLIDCTGRSAYGWAGAGGMPAAGESRYAQTLHGNWSPDILGHDRARFANRSTLLVGSGCAAASTAIALAELFESAPETRLTWVTRRETTADQPGPVLPIDGGRLPRRDAWSERANRLVREAHPAIVHLPGSSIARLEAQNASGPFTVTVEGQHAGEIAADVLALNVGARPDLSLARELQVQYCYASDAAEGLGRVLRGKPLPSDVAPDEFQPSDLLTKEPDFYILGAKSFGRDPRFTIAHGLRQIRDLFRIIGDRENLDLYASAASNSP